ncbi:MAG: type II toxin-antitoxin system VapC family toxin [Acidobacteriota bacterium]|nr:type II toxin-antitoxin system VapC family toxin [Acidobacteriota bacterium]
MIALDTNVLVRLLVADEPRQHAQAEQLLVDSMEAGEACFLSDPVLCELAWVLESCYDASRADILAALRDLLSRDLVVFSDRAVIREAVERYRHGKAGFADYLIGALGRIQGARATYTFDRSLLNQEGFAWIAG